MSIGEGPLTSCVVRAHTWTAVWTLSRLRWQWKTMGATTTVNWTYSSDIVYSIPTWATALQADTSAKATAAQVVREVLVARNTRFIGTSSRRRAQIPYAGSFLVAQGGATHCSGQASAGPPARRWGCVSLAGNVASHMRGLRAGRTRAGLGEPRSPAAHPRGGVGLGGARSVGREVSRAASVAGPGGGGVGADCTCEGGFSNLFRERRLRRSPHAQLGGRVQNVHQQRDMAPPDSCPGGRHKAAIVTEHLE